MVFGTEVVFGSLFAAGALGAGAVFGSLGPAGTLGARAAEALGVDSTTAGLGSALATSGFGACVTSALGAGVTSALGAGMISAFGAGTTAALGAGAGAVATSFGAVWVTATLRPWPGISGSVSFRTSSANFRWLSSSCSARR